MNRKVLKERAKDFLDKNKKIMMPIGVFATIIMMLTIFFSAKQEMIILENGRILFINKYNNLISWANPIFICLFWSIFISVRLGHNISFNKILDKISFTKIWRTFLVELLIIIKVLCWMLLFIIPGIIKIYEYLLVPFIVFEDDNISFSEAFAISKDKMQGYKFDYFLLELSFIGWFLLLGLTMGIAAIYVIPYYYATISIFVSDKLNEPVRKY